MKIKIVTTSAFTVVPSKAHTDDAGYDVYTTEDLFIQRDKKRNVVKIGIKMELPDPCSKWYWKLLSLIGFQKYRYYAWIRPRSGFSAKGMAGYKVPSEGDDEIRFNCDVLDGIVDSGYRDDVGVIVKCTSDGKFVIPRGTKIAQMIIGRSYDAEFVKVVQLSESERDGGFGKSGVR